jgi:hypothetical protein
VGYFLIFLKIAFEDAKKINFDTQQISMYATSIPIEYALFTTRFLPIITPQPATPQWYHLQGN